VSPSTGGALAVYHPGRSPLHRLPAGIKLLALVGAAVGTHWVDRPERVAIALLVVVALYAVGRIPMRLLVAQVRPLLWMIVVLLVAQVLLADWRVASVVTGNLVALVLLAALVTLTTRTTALVDTIVAGCHPLRFLGIDPERVGLLLALGIRSVAVVIGLAGQVREAQVARGLTASPLAFAVPLMVRSLRHADALAEALVARGLDD
jgi:biotin transport system permease protein